MKKQFKCGHKGKGKSCHRCEQALVALDKSKDKKLGEKEQARLKAESDRLFSNPKKTSDAVAVSPQ